MRPRTSQPRSIGHLIGSVLLLLGMAAMHHLVVSGCGAAVVEHVPVAAGVPATGHVIEHSGPEASEPSRGTHEADKPSGTGSPVDHSGAALCLAVVVSAWLLTPLLRFRRVARVTPSFLQAPTAVAAVPPRPPDLNLLSVCRT